LYIYILIYINNIKNIFYNLKEKLWTDEILRKLNPRESVLFNDPLSRGKVFNLYVCLLLIQ